jgi:hypothetical protein
MKSLSYKLLAGLALVSALVGCQSTQQMMDSRQPAALDEAINRGRFEMNCPAATGSVLSETMLQPALQCFRCNGVQRAEYTIGVSGCGQRATYMVICPLDTSGCWTAGARNEIR